MVEHSKKLKSMGKVEYLQYSISDDGALESIVWYYDGSKEVVRRCTDVFYID